MTPPTSQDDCHSANRRIGNDNSCHCEERSDVAIRSPSDSKGIGQCFALQGSRIATLLRARNDEVREAGAPVWAWAVIEGGRWGHDPTLLWFGKISKKLLTIQKFMLKYAVYCNAIRKRSSPRHHERRRDSESLRWDTLRATFVRPERSGRVLPIQSS